MLNLVLPVYACNLLQCKGHCGIPGRYVRRMVYMVFYVSVCYSKIDDFSESMTSDPKL